MGTSAMTYVYIDGKCELSTCTGSDGYPEDHGQSLLGFVSNRKNLEKLRRSVSKCRTLSEDEVDALRRRSRRWEDEYIDEHPDYVYYDDVRLLTRIIADEGNVTFRSWTGGSNLDDWAYVIDFDRMTFEVYKGFNEVPLEKQERFYDGSGPDKNGYYPFKEVAIFDLNNLPSFDEFIELCDRRP